MKFLIACSLFLIAILGGCAAQGTSPPMAPFAKNHAAVQYGVVLNPTGSDLKVKSKPKGWNKNGKKDGYVGFAEGESGLVTFGIKGEDVDDKCPFNTEGEAKWVITKIELSATGNPETEKGDNFGGDQSEYPWLKEAFPGVDLSNGRVFPPEGFPEVDKYGGRSTVAIFSANQQEGETFAYYQVTATRCSTGASLKTDPGIGNGGRR